MPRTACDVCYNKKEKCVFDGDSTFCKFCVAHKQPCRLTRPERRMGRPPVVKNLPHGHSGIILGLDIPSSHKPSYPRPQNNKQSIQFQSPRDLGLEQGNLNPLVLLHSSANKHHLLNALTDRQIFYTFHRNFMIGPSFAESFRLSIQTILPCSNISLLKAYDAVFAVWDDVGQRVKPPEEIDLSEGRDCLKNLVQFGSTSDLLNNASILMLGQILIVYHLFTTCTSAWAINRHAILSAKKSYSDLLAQPIFDPISITPILFDTAESLIRREIPVIQVPKTDRFIVDRSVGLCWSLLPLLHELCEVSERMKTWSSQDLLKQSHERLSEVDDAFTAVERAIRAWEPSAPPTLFEDFTSIEVAAMLTQARVYRTAALLLIHRLRYPLGVEDAVARWHANMICAELTGFVNLTPEDMRGLPVGLPLLVAMLETRESASRIIRGLGLFASHPQHLAALDNFVGLAWAARRGGFQGLWFDLVHVSLQVPIVP
ncbi:hypothetical protein K456DRAFT_331472 [Colletotrichum gloeosporioides 23]|nr:hypothetical protein K456DRAFT_331472 [Colletotrichum gloeosporioides 23]